jgi:serine/threonine-protein kinase
MIVPQPASGVPRFGTYELLSPLSTSFFGMRQRARLAHSGVSGMHALGSGADASSQELRALRIVCAETSEIIERVAHAATLARHATHPALLPPLQIVRGRGQIGIATQDVAGITLRDLMQRAAAQNEAIPQAVALRITLDVLAGLNALETAIPSSGAGAALYGGLTPDSILVGADGQTRLIDPGVQAAAARMSAWRRDLSLLECTAPELIADGVRCDARVDLFSIGVIAWQMLSGRALFARKTAQEMVDALLNAPIARAQRVRFARGEPVTRAVASAVDRALQRDRATRYQSYGQLAASLRDAANAASREDVAAYVADERGAPSQASAPRDIEHTGKSPLVFEDGPPTAKIPRIPATPPAASAAPAAPAASAESAEQTVPNVLGRGGEPTSEVVVDVAAISGEVTSQLPVGIEISAPPSKPAFRLTPRLIAGVVVIVAVLAAWVLESSLRRTTPSTTVTREAPATTAAHADPPAPAAANTNQAPVVPVPPTTAPASESSTAPKLARTAQPRAGLSVRPKPASARIPDVKGRKQAPKLFIPSDI